MHESYIESTVHSPVLSLSELRRDVAAARLSKSSRIAQKTISCGFIPLVSEKRALRYFAITCESGSCNVVALSPVLRSILRFFNNSNKNCQKTP